ncbi:MAG: MauE/DoxX family redox-associated membrane protein [Microbacterium sp.]
MPGPLSIIPPLLVASVLIASGVAKLRRPDDLVGWADLGVPATLRRTWLLRFHPWGEIVLGAALALLGGVLGELASIVVLALMAGYLIFVVRIVQAGTDTTCACFGARKKITAMTVVRNGWYVLLSAAAVATAWANPLWGGPVAALDGAGWLWAIGLAAAGVTVALTMWPAPVEGEAPAAVQAVPAASDDDDDYVRVRTPSVPVTRADGELVNVRTLSMTGQPLMLLALNPGCGSCVGVYEKLAAIRALLPEVSVRLLLTGAPETSGWTEKTEPQSLHDPKRYVRDSIAEWSTPSAVLLGMDGLLAGGPVTGGSSILQFVDDVYESLHGVRPEQPLGAAS